MHHVTPMVGEILGEEFCVGCDRFESKVPRNKRRDTSLNDRPFAVVEVLWRSNEYEIPALAILAVLSNLEEASVNEVSVAEDLALLRILDIAVEFVGGEEMENETPVAESPFSASPRVEVLA